jgi:signal transduction histidine kinase
VHPDVDELLEDSWNGRGRVIRGRELRVELIVNAGFFAACAALLAAAPPHRAPELAVVAVVAGYALAARVQFPIGAAFFAPTELFLVPLFVLAPASLVPVLVFAALALAALWAQARGDARLDRLVFCAGDAAHVLGPAVVIAVLADGEAVDAGVAVVVAAFAAQFVADAASSGVHEMLTMGARPRVHLRMMTTVWAADVALGAVALAVACAAMREPWAALTPLPLVLLLRELATDRRRRIEAAHERLNLLDQEKGRRQAAAALLERQNEFLQDVSHALLTPVTIAHGFIETLERTRGASAESGVALDELERIERIVRRLLMLARAEERGEAAVEEVDAEALIEDRFVRWSDTTPRPWRLGDVATGTIMADGDALRAALDALIENAVKHTTPSQEIRLTSRAAGDTLFVEVADEGSGIPDEALERIFARFGRVDPGRDRLMGGVGLGLAIVASVARAHGGDCTVVSSPAGSTFTLRLARFRAAPAAEPAEEPEAPPAASPSPVLGDPLPRAAR